MRLAVALFALVAAFLAPVQARDICTLVADAAMRTILLQQGDCETRVTPASTFKLPLAIMAWDAGIITATTAPKLAFKPGYADWGGAAWQQDTDPAMWMKHSTVWFSQRLAERLGAHKLATYGQSFGYGNADFSGDAGKNNGLERSWISSSLTVSPIEQASFLAALVEGKLPVSPAAMSGAMALVQQGGESAGWTLKGKTGSAYPRLADGSLDRKQGWGWYVGWAEKAGRQLVFVRLTQDEQRHEVTGGLRAQQKLLADWPALMAASGL